MPHPALPMVIMAVILIVFGRVKKQNLVAIVGYLVLALALIVVLATR